MTIPKRKKKNGRPRLSADELRSGVIRMRCTPAEEEKYVRLGGNSWLRKALRRARVPRGEPLNAVSSTDAAAWTEVKELVNAIVKPRRKASG